VSECSDVMPLETLPRPGRVQSESGAGPLRGQAVDQNTHARSGLIILPTKSWHQNYMEQLIRLWILRVRYLGLHPNPD
jgi:hypothetical protein